MKHTCASAATECMRAARRQIFFEASKEKKTILHNQLDLCYTRAYTKSRVEEERDGKGIEANTDGMTCVRAYMCARAEERVQHNTTYHVHHKSATDVDCRQRAQLWLCVCVQH